MTRITENTIESFAIGLLNKLGYEYIYAPDIAPEFPSFGGVSEGRGGKFPSSGEMSEDRGGTDQRETYEQVLLLRRLQQAVKHINPSIPADAQAEAIKEIQRIASPELLANNETFHRLLTEGIPVSKRVGGDDRGDRVWLIDFKNP